MPSKRDLRIRRWDSLATLLFRLQCRSTAVVCGGAMRGTRKRAPMSSLRGAWCDPECAMTSPRSSLSTWPPHISTLEETLGTVLGWENAAILSPMHFALGTPLIFSTGYDRAVIEVRFEARPVLHKPYDFPELSQSLTMPCRSNARRAEGRVWQSCAAALRKPARSSMDAYTSRLCCVRTDERGCPAWSGPHFVGQSAVSGAEAARVNRITTRIPLPGLDSTWSVALALVCSD